MKIPLSGGAVPVFRARPSCRRSPQEDPGHAEETCLLQRPCLQQRRVPGCTSGNQIYVHHQDSAEDGRCFQQDALITADQVANVLAQISERPTRLCLSDHQLFTTLMFPVFAPGDQMEP